ncbi:MAG: hypothetical protein M3Y45_00715, partial [Actinomycetota bacterium]|nr:hypothetical protein [Actinomycetota bacterium]
MKPVAEIKLPEIDSTDPDLRGRRWHRTANRLLDSGKWLARSPLAVVVLDREAGEFFLRSREAIFPGRLIGELFGIDSGPLHDQIEANIINRQGQDHRRLRGLV